MRQKLNSVKELKSYYNNYHQDDNKSFKVLRQSRNNSFDPLILFLPLNPKARFLDIACGRGWLLKKAEEKGLKNCFGIDLSLKALKISKLINSRRLVCCNVNLGLPFAKDSIFDYITCWGSLEHFESQKLVIKEISRICKHNGKILIQVPNDNYFLHKLGYETDDQPIINRYNLQGWLTLLNSNGLKIDKVIKGNFHLSNLSVSSSYLKSLLSG